MPTQVAVVSSVLPMVVWLSHFSVGTLCIHYNGRNGAKGSNPQRYYTLAT